MITRMLHDQGRLALCPSLRVSYSWHQRAATHGTGMRRRSPDIASNRQDRGSGQILNAPLSHVGIKLPPGNPGLVGVKHAVGKEAPCCPTVLHTSRTSSSSDVMHCSSLVDQGRSPPFLRLTTDRVDLLVLAPRSLHVYTVLAVQGARELHAIASSPVELPKRHFGAEPR